MRAVIDGNLVLHVTNWSDASFPVALITLMAGASADILEGGALVREV